MILQMYKVRRQVARQAGAYPGLCSTQRQGEFLLYPAWDTSPSH